MQIKKINTYFLTFSRVTTDSIDHSLVKGSSDHCLQVTWLIYSIMISWNDFYVEYQIMLKNYFSFYSLSSLFLKNGYTSMFFCHFYKEEQLLWHPVCFPGRCNPSDTRSSLKEKNLLLGEQIPSFKSSPHWERMQKWKWQRQASISLPYESLLIRGWS